MRVFVTVADLGGFAPAARRLRLSPATATRMVAALESRLDVRLLQRTTRAVSLTDAGARFCDRARRILGDLDEAEGVARSERSEPSGRLVVTAPVLFGKLHVAPVFSAYLGRHPAVAGELRLSDALVHLVEEGVDLAVRIGPLRDSSLVARAVGRTRRVLVASPAYLERRGTPRSPRDLARHDLIHMTGLGAPPEWRFHRRGESLVVPLAPRLTTNSAEVALDHAARAGGLTVALAYQAAPSVRAGRLRVVLPGFEPPPVPIHLVYPSVRRLSAKVRAFADLVAATCDWRFTDL